MPKYRKKQKYLYDGQLNLQRKSMTGMNCIFVTDLHGKPDRYDILFSIAETECPDWVLIGGDLLPGGYGRSGDIGEFLSRMSQRIRKVRETCGRTRFFIIPGNDDPRVHEPMLERMANDGLIEYVQQKCVTFGGLSVVGYSFVPPSPFLLKDWEKYDVSRFTGVGCVSPEEGIRTVEVTPEDARYSTIEKDLVELAKLSDPGSTVYLFHAPPSDTPLDRTANDGKFVDHAPADIHVGSIAIRRFIEKTSPLLTLHGHIHESVRLTGDWRVRLGKSHSFGGSHDGPGLAVVRFSTDNLDNATREVVTHR